MHLYVVLSYQILAAPGYVTGSKRLIFTERFQASTSKIVYRQIGPNCLCLTFCFTPVVTSRCQLRIPSSLLMTIDSLFCAFVHLGTFGRVAAVRWGLAFLAGSDFTVSRGSELRAARRRGLVTARRCCHPGNNTVEC